jgi:hypothetical protein
LFAVKGRQFRREERGTTLVADLSDRAAFDPVDEAVMAAPADEWNDHDEVEKWQRFVQGNTLNR